MRVLVTGGAGFIGSHLVDRLNEAGHDVSIIDDLSGGKEEYADAKLYRADCRNEALIEDIFRQIKPEIVFHLAANAAENKAQFSPVDITSRNYSAFINVLTSFIRHKGKRFIFTSSIAVYGGIQAPFYEVDKPEPEDLYGITKLAAEQTLKVMSEVHGFEYVIARPHNVYGPRQNMTDPYRNVVTIWMNAILKGKPYYIYGNGEQVRCFSYIDDVADALFNCGFSDVSRKALNVGADKGYTLNELSQAIMKASGSSLKPEYLESRPQEVKVAVADHTLAKTHLNYEDSTSLEEGIKKTWEWVKMQGYQEPIYTELELKSNKTPINWRIQL